LIGPNVLVSQFQGHGARETQNRVFGRTIGAQEQKPEQGRHKSHVDAIALALREPLAHGMFRRQKGGSSRISVKKAAFRILVCSSFWLCKQSGFPCCIFQKSGILSVQIFICATYYRGFDDIL